MRTEILDKLSPALNRVELVETSTILPEGFITNSGNEFAIITDLPEGGRKVVNYVSKEYNLHKNEDIIFPIIEALESNFGEITQVGVQANYNSQFKIDLFWKPEHVEKGTQYPGYSTFNTYDSYGLLGGRGCVMEVWCGNGCAKTIREFLTYKVKHNDLNFDVEKILKSVDHFLNQEFEEILERDVKLKSVSTKTGSDKDKLAKFMRQVIRDTNLYAHFPVSAITPTQKATNEPELLKNNYAVDIAIKEMKDGRTGSKFTMNYYLAYQAMNYILNHDITSSLSAQRRTITDQKLYSHFVEMAG